MGDPAELGREDRFRAKDIAEHIVDAVVNDTAEPMKALQFAAECHGVPLETALLWLAQLVAER
jgi:hypothetical protein